MQNKNIRLSKNIIPLEYDIILKPDLDNFTFEGTETITILSFKPTKSIVLHSKEIEIITASMLIDKERVFAKISYNQKKETASFIFPKQIPQTKSVQLSLSFRGILNDKMRGFYRSNYSIKNKEYYMATTQFEATDARKAFPCFDEPAQKAVFNISLIIPEEKSAISNTLPISISKHEAGLFAQTGYKIVKFSPTPKMSTYLLAFIVGDFEYIEKKSKSGVTVRVHTTPGKKHLASFALDVTVRALEFYEKYFDIPYPLNTLDMIAIPDFSSLAMENWGAITFREVGILLDEKNTSTSSKELIAEVITHELAHQWFGNLVTMEWWTHLWLNEGFASYIPYIVTEKLFPEWNIWDRFVTDTQGIALKLDALETTHPIEVEVHNPDEIGEIFDAVSYSKGASVIRMLAEYLGKDNFRNGLRYYLKKHSYKNTETIHLWQAFEKVSKKPVTKIMHNWTSKPGYPVIKVEIIKNELSLSQNRFFANLPSKARYLKSKKETTWQIPISIGNNKSNIEMLLSDKNLKIPKPKDWIKINMSEVGFYRTAYEKSLLDKLIDPTQKKLLSSNDRMGIIRDLFALAEAGVVPTTDALEFLKAFKNEDNYTVWLEIAMGLAKIEQLLAKTSSINELNNFVISLFSPLLLKLGWEKKKTEIHTDTFLRSLTISRLGNSGDKKTIREAKNYFLKIQKGEYVHPDIRRAIYSIIAKSGGLKEYNALIKQYKKETLHEEKNRIGDVLGNFSNSEILKMVCEFALSKEVRKQDSVSILSGVGANPIGRDIWWNFMKKNWKILVSRYGEGGLTLGRAVKAIGGSAEKKHFESLKKFFTSHEAPGAKRSIEQVMERMEGNVAWLNRDKKTIEKFLKNYLKI